MLNPIVAANFNPIKMRKDSSVYWHFSTHSLRRTFAHFVVGNGFVSLTASKHQFKHISLAMTAIYASHDEVLSLLGIENPANERDGVFQNTLARELTDIRAAEKVMRDHNIEFEKFNLGAL